ncbi:hypothetical protein R1sor_017143 [Riccia sorocarpa]|uniref:Uncharacterized protein n=1 Tax=Riccia sorocarpa TaxID=122646 RepID=A0ABD3I736_9MARC
MGRVSMSLLVLVALAAMVVSAPTMTAARSHHNIYRVRDEESDVFCVGHVVELLQWHEGRHQRAYDHEGGYRAVGAGYNLDDEKDNRRKELEEAGLDYDKVYNGETRLNQLQISGLLVLDAQRALRRAEKNIERLRDFCCSVRAVFAEIQHSVGSAKNFPRDDLNQVIEKAASRDWGSAADELQRTKWCSQQAGKYRNRCNDHLDLVDRGCQSAHQREGCY